jgi:hypothetical protein
MTTIRSKLKNEPSGNEVRKLEMNSPGPIFVKSVMGQAIKVRFIKPVVAA